VQPQVTAVARPGDTIAIESQTYFGLLHVLEALGLRALELPTDAQHGVDLAFLASPLEARNVFAGLPRTDESYHSHYKPTNRTVQ
jgi:DNA-binding transcriptional MocR family regulator